MLESAAGFSVTAQKEDSRNQRLRESIVPNLPPWLFGGQFLRGDGAGGAFLIRILDFGPEGARLILLAFSNIEVGQVELRHSCGDGLRGLGNERVVDVDGLGVARGLAIEAGKSEFGQVGKIVIPGARLRL